MFDERPLGRAEGRRRLVVTPNRARVAAFG